MVSYTSNQSGGGARNGPPVQRLLNDILNLPLHPIRADRLHNVLTLAVTVGWLCTLAAVAFFVLIGVILLLRNLAPLFSLALRKAGIGKLSPADTFLEITIPATTAKSAYATERLHVLLRNRGRGRSFTDRLAGQKRRYSSELVGTNDAGIRYILAVPGSEATYVTRNLLSFLPTIKIRQVPDYLDALHDTKVGIIELKQGADFVLPLEGHKLLEEHDSMAFITTHMTKLMPGELVAYQVVTTPVMGSTHRRAMRHVRKIQTAIARNEGLSEVLAKKAGLPHAVWFIVAPPLWLLIMIVKFVVSIPIAIMYPGSPDFPIPDSRHRKRKSTNPYDQELARIVKPKLDQQLFEVSIRVLAASPDSDTIQERLEGIVSALRMFDSTYQVFVSKRTIPLSKRLRAWQADRRLRRFRKRELPQNVFPYGTIVSSSELSDLYHFANTETTKTEGLVKSRSKELAAPLSIRHSAAKLDVIVGTNRHGGSEQPIGMTLEQRQKHTYVIGKTGTGKTTLLKSSIYQDMMSGKGLAVLDPHGDMFRELLELVPEHRMKDVVVFNPGDRQFPPGLNILDPEIDFGDEEDTRDWTASMVIAVFQKLTDERQWGDRMEHILRSTVLTALLLPNHSLYTLQQLLTDKKYQRKVAAGLKDPVLKQFWYKEMLPMGDMQLTNYVLPLTHRLGHFITATMSRNILLQEKSTIRMSDIMDEGKILLVNLSKGDIGEDQSFFFGTLLTSLIWMSAYQRARIVEADRREFFVYVDEFQNFAAPRFAEIASEARKFRISLTVSHQNIAQIDDQKILKNVAGNAHTIICLKANPDDEAFILPYMKPVVEKGDIINLTPYHFFMKTTAHESEDAFSGVTVPLDVQGSDDTKQSVIASSREHYATPRKQVEQYLDTLFSVTGDTKKTNEESDPDEDEAQDTAPKVSL